jgi:hypothetical protein
MGKLKPIGSEKLQGTEKINRILELSTYKLNIPKSINEDKSLEYSKVLADGNKYHIIKEKSGYVIKKGLNESTSEYIEPIKNRKYYSSYSQALKRLNLITKEVNVNEGYVGNLSLFNENEKIDGKKYILKYGETNEQEVEIPAAPVAPTAPQTPPPAGELPAPAPEVGVEEPVAIEEPMDGEMEIEEPMGTEMEEKGGEDVVTFKTIQKLTGKLAQKIRSFTSDEENEMSSQDVKYVINSILSDLDLDLLEPEDAEEIMSKFEGQEDEEIPSDEMGGEEEIEMMPEPEIEAGVEGEEMTPEPPMAPEGEMAEMYPRHNRRESFEERQNRLKMKEMSYGVSESKVEKILQKYFNETPKNINENKVERLSESYQQEILSKKFVKKYPNAEFLGKTKKGTLVFEMNGEKYGVTTSGKLL